MIGTFAAQKLPKRYLSVHDWVMGIKVMDHVIIGDDYFSFVDDGIMQE